MPRLSRKVAVSVAVTMLLAVMLFGDAARVDVMALAGPATKVVLADDDVPA